MSLVSRTRGLARHRGKSPMQLRAELDEAVCALVALTTEVDTLRAERDLLEQQLDQAGIDLSGALEDLRAERAETLSLQAVLDNATATAVPPSHRDVDPDDQPTHPAGIDVRDLRARFAVGPVVSLWHSPQAADPAHIPRTIPVT